LPSAEHAAAEGCLAEPARGNLQAVKVVEGLSGGIAPGCTVSVAELGLPVKGTNGLLLVFWKAT